MEQKRLNAGPRALARDGAITALDLALAAIDALAPRVEDHDNHNSLAHARNCHSARVFRLRAVRQELESMQVTE